MKDNTRYWELFSLSVDKDIVLLARSVSGWVSAERVPYLSLELSTLKGSREAKALKITAGELICSSTRELLSTAVL